MIAAIKVEDCAYRSSGPLSYTDGCDRARLTDRQRHVQARVGPWNA